MANPRRRPFGQRPSARISRSARQSWQNTDSAKAVTQISSLLKAGGAIGSRASTAIQQAIRDWQRQSTWSAESITQLAGAEFGGLVREIQRYLRQGGAEGRLVVELLGALGPLGSLIKSLATAPPSNSHNTLNDDIESAVRFLDAVAPNALSGPGQRAAQSPARWTRSTAQQVEAAIEFLQSEGYEVTSPAEIESEAKKPTYPGGVPTETERGGPRKVVELDIDGAKRRFSVDHPIVTGNYVEYTSSNVHSFAYQYDKTRLLVRYHPSATAGRGKGTLYAYENVPPRKFLALLNAPSKGAWLWDHIRIRGTVSGHQHDYRLVAVTGGYVPRKATYTPQGEMYVPREMRFQNLGDKQFRVLKSALPAGPVNVPPGRGRR